MQNRKILIIGILLLVGISSFLLFRQSALYCENRLPGSKKMINAQNTDCGGIGRLCPEMQMIDYFDEECIKYSM